MRLYFERYQMTRHFGHGWYQAAKVTYKLWFRK